VGECVAMMTDEEIKLQTRLTAIESMLCRLIARRIQELPNPIDAADQMIANYRQGLAQQTIAGLDAAQSDLFASEYEQAMMRLVMAAREFVVTSLTK
jgi:hypothetical protein